MSRNLERLTHLKKFVHDLSYFAALTGTGAFRVLSNLIEDKLVRGRPKVLNKLLEAHIGENNQKIALDAPHRFKSVMREAEALIDLEIVKEKRALRELDGQKRN